MRLAAYAGTSTVLATGVVIQALHQRTNFYSACVYLAQSNACLMILTNLLLICVCAVMLGLQRLFYGPLRPIEIEQLYEKAWFAITETCLAMTIFREEVGGWFLVMFVSLLIGKVWGWIGEGRVDILEQQPPANPRLFHARLSFSLFLSLAYGICMLDYSVTTVLRQARPNMMVMFAFEFAVLTITSLSTAARYAISLKEAYIIKTRTREQLEERRAELRAARDHALRQLRTPGGTDIAELSNARIPDPDTVEEMDIDVPGWEGKGRWVFYLNLTTDFLKLVVYLSFFAILFTFYGLPIHIMRDVFLTLRSFFKRITDFLRYRNATRDMNERYPDATAEDIGREDVCIICREEMRPWQQPNNQEEAGREGLRPARRQPRTVDERLRPKKLPCGHVLHFGCLRSWLERQQICPTCRRPVLANNSRFRMVPANAPVANNFNQPLAGQPQPNQHQQLQGNRLGQAAQGQFQGPLNRARVFNLGPFRFAFGQAHGNPFQDQAQVANNGLARQQAANPAAPQQYGFSFGFQRNEPNPPHTNAAQFSPASVQAQLHQIEQQIMQNINALRASADQLAMVRALQGELARLRIAQVNPGATALPSLNAPAAYGNRQMHHAAQLMQAAPPMQAYGPPGQMTALGAGHEDLPPGLTLPEGWSLLPLQRLQQDLVGGQPTQLPLQHTHSHSYRTTGQSLHPAGMSAQISARLVPASSPSGLPRPPPASGVSSANALPRLDSLTATRESNAETTTPHAQSEQALPSAEDLARLIADLADLRRDVPESGSAGREQNDAPQPSDNVTSDGSHPADGIESAEIGQLAPAANDGNQPANESAPTNNSQEPPATIPIWGTALHGKQETQDNADGASAPAPTFSEPSRHAAPAESTSSSQANGKSRAATVEDFIDDVD